MPPPKGHSNGGGGSTGEGTVYFFGDTEGTLVKAGWAGPTRSLKERQKELEKQLNCRLLLLAAARGDRTSETSTHSLWEEYRHDGFLRQREVYFAVPEITEYVNWLRRQWWATLEVDQESDARVSAAEWLPRADRRVPPPPVDETRLIQVERSFTGGLAGTPWDWMSTPQPTVDGDYYTPPELIWNGAAEAMGGVDLDVASHWIANRRLKIPDYFDLNRSAFDHDWYGRVWNNAPFGNNAPWFERALHFWGLGEVEQMCMLAPAWAFITKISREYMETASAWCLLSPTPRFWGNSAGRQGRNDPHMVVYHGPRVAEFSEAFARFGHVAEAPRLGAVA